MEVRLIKKTDFLEITQFYAMEKNLFRLYCLMLCVWPMLAGAAEIDSLLDRLDAVIKERPHYIEVKKNRLLELKLRLYPGLPAEERFEQLGLLFEEYRSFNADSSQAIVRERIRKRWSGWILSAWIRWRATCARIISTTCARFMVGWPTMWWCPRKRRATTG